MNSKHFYKKQLLTLFLFFVLIIEGFGQEDKQFKFIFINKFNLEKIRFMSVEINYYLENKLMRERSYTTDNDGLIVIDKFLEDSIFIQVNPKYEYCSYMNPLKQSFKLKKMNLSDTTYLNVNYSEAELNSNFTFFFRPFGLDCINVYGQNIKNNNVCFCFYDTKCDFLYPALELLKCNQNLVLELNGNCSEKEFLEFKDSLIYKRLLVVKQLFEDNNIELSRIKMTSYGKDKPKTSSNAYKETKLLHKKVLLEVTDTYINAKITRR